MTKPFSTHKKARNSREIYEFFSVMVSSPVIGLKTRWLSEFMVDLVNGDIEDDEAVRKLHTFAGERMK